VLIRSSPSLAFLISIAHLGLTEPLQDRGPTHPNRTADADVAQLREVWVFASEYFGQVRLGVPKQPGGAFQVEDFIRIRAGRMGFCSCLTLNERGPLAIRGSGDRGPSD
jgi:hypothetical protein